MCVKTSWWLSIEAESMKVKVGVWGWGGGGRQSNNPKLTQKWYVVSGKTHRIETRVQPQGVEREKKRGSWVGLPLFLGTQKSHPTWSSFPKTIGWRRLLISQFIISRKKREIGKEEGGERVDRQTEEERDRNRETERSYKYCSRVTSNRFPPTMPYPLKYGQFSIMLSNCHAVIGVTQWWIQIVMIHW